jgi:glycosyltransferase involved in cell wall biosynthesis
MRTLTDRGARASTRRRLIYVGTLPPHQGGSAVSGFQLLVGLARAGHAVRSLAPITPEADRAGDSFVGRYRELGVTRFRVPYFETSPHTPAAEEYRRLEQEQIEEKLSLLIEREQPDILLMGRETFAWHVPDLAKRCALPCILRIAGGFLTGIVDGNYPAALVSQWLAEAHKIDLIVAQTASVTASLAALGLNRTRIIPNGVDLRLFAPQPQDEALRRELGIDDDTIVVMHLSNLKPLKRAVDIVDSAARALKFNRRLVYVIVGDGFLRQAMEEACRSNGIAEHFRFVGWVEYSRVPAYLNLADLVVMPSDAEAQARVYLETQACARTLLASDIPGARHVVEDGETGLLFRKGDVEDLTAKTLQAAADAPLRSRIGSQARRRVMAHSLDDVVAAYAAAIEHVLENHRSRHDGQALVRIGGRSG